MSRCERAAWQLSAVLPFVVCNSLQALSHPTSVGAGLVQFYPPDSCLHAGSTNSIWKWSDDADAKLHDCFARTDWNMFREYSNGIEEYTTVTGFINKCIDDDVPTVTVRTYPNQKPWITGNICTELKGRAASFKERDL